MNAKRSEGMSLGPSSTAPPLVDTNGTLTRWGGEHAAHMIVFGGRSLGGSGPNEDGHVVSEICLNDTHILDLDTLRWIPSSLGLGTASTATVAAGQGPGPVSVTNEDDKGLNHDHSQRSPEEQQNQTNTAAAVTATAATAVEGDDRPGGGVVSAGEDPVAVSESEASDMSTGQTAEQSSDPAGQEEGHSSKQTQSSSATFQAKHDPYQHHTPMACFAHLASLTGDHMVVIGGRGFGNEYIQEISVLNLKTHLWMKGGKCPGHSSQGQTTLTSVEERPMARRRRRYLECLAAEQAPRRRRSSLTISTFANTHLSSTGTAVAVAKDRRSTPHSPVSPTAMITPLLNPRKNSWHRGEGHPFEPPLILAHHRQRFMSESGISLSMERDDNIWASQVHPPKIAELSSKAAGVLGPDTESESEKSIGSHEAAPKSRQPSLAGSSKSSHTPQKATNTAPSIRSNASAGSEMPRARSQSHAASTMPPSSSTGRRTPSNPQAPVTHAVPKKFFAKSSGSMFDLDNLATTIAREQKGLQTLQPPKSKDPQSRGPPARERSQQMRRSNSNSASSTSSRKSDGTTDEARGVIRRTRRDLDIDDKSDKRRSLDSALDSVNFAGISAGEEKTPDHPRFQAHPTPVSQPLYMYSNHVATADNKLKRDFVKVQSTRAPNRFSPTKIFYDIRPEWTALDLGSGALGGSEGLVPPRMIFPAAQIVDHYFLLSGASVEDEAATNTLSSSHGGPSVPPTPTSHMTPRHPSEGSGLSSTSGRRLSFSVWIHHFHNHQWTQLELSKNLRSGEWSQSILDREGNFLYILGRRMGDHYGHQHTETSLLSSSALGDGTLADSEVGLESPLAVGSFTHIIKVDLEGLEICPAVDESSVGPGGVRLGLDMLRDGIGADVVLVSTADGGRVRVNSGIVGQRWGYFQALMQERDRIRELETKERIPKKYCVDADSEMPPEDSLEQNQVDGVHASRRRHLRSKQWYLSDQPAEIAIRETTPILVGFLQYIYTNELVTSHQLRLKTLQGLLLLAHFYDLTRLQQLARRALYQQLNANNAPAICEVAVLTHEFGLQTRALRTLLQSARLAQLRRLGEAAEAKRRLDFAMSRQEEIEEDRKRKASMHASLQLMNQAQGHGNINGNGTAASNSGGGIGSSGSGNGPPAPRAMANIGSPALSAGNTAAILRQGSMASTVSGPTSSTPGLSTIGRFFRHREESTESVGPMV
ncbi:hypothetical protein BGZ58_009082 [Dissophora ornata]|nr:hypothetical protein BGZ58_009082 [Dissophora ornata]